MNKSEKSNTSDTLINIGAGYSQFKAGIGLVIAFFIFIFTTYYGYTMYNTYDVYGENKIKGTVNDSKCNSYKNNNKSIEYDCSFNILYNIDNSNYKKHMDTYSTNNYSNGQQIDIRYNTYDKNDITTNTFSNQKIGVVAFFIGFFILIISGIYLYILLKYKYVAAGVTAMSAVSTVVSPIYRT